MAVHPGSAAAFDTNGLIREDVMDQIWDISKIPLPFTDMVGSDTCDKSYTEWVEDSLGDPATGGWVVDGADASGNDVAKGTRLGNHCGQLSKVLSVTHRTNASGTIGHGNELSYQVMMRQRELRRNVEANALGIQGSASDDGDATAGQPAGLAAMVTQYDTGSGATGGGFSSSSWTAVTPGTRTALSEADVNNAIVAAYEDGSDPTKIMSVPAVIQRLSEYLLSGNAKVATLQTQTGTAGQATAVGAVATFIGPHGLTLTMVPNRIQRTYEDVATNDAAAVFILDPNYARLSFLQGYRTEPLAKTGTADKRQITVDFTVKALHRDAHRVLLDINPATDMVA